MTTAERLDLPVELSMALTGLGGTWINSGRPHAGLMLLRGGHALALEIGYGWPERQARNLLSFYEQWNEPAAGLLLVRDGFEIARQIGSTLYAFLMVGNGCVCALRVGDWDWAADVLDDWLGRDLDNDQTAEFMTDRAVLRALRGGDAASDLEEAITLASDLTDPQFAAYIAWAQSWLALSRGDMAEAIDKARVASETVTFFPAMARPMAARAALWSGDAAAARAEMDRLHVATSWGRALTLDEATIAAGIAAVEGRSAEALAAYREVFAGWRSLNLAWDEALAVIDAATLLGADEPDIKVAADWARSTLTRLGAKPYLDRLDTAMNAKQAPADQAVNRALETVVSEAATAG